MSNFITRNRRWKLTTAILSLSLLTVMAGAAVAPALNLIRDYFADANTGLVQMIISLPALFIALTSFLFRPLCKRFRARTLVLIGLILYTVGGCLAGAFSSIFLVLVFRAVVGIGVGIIMPLSTGLISFYFTKDKQAPLMGMSSAMNMMGGVVATLIAGALAMFSWRLAFLVYLMGLISIVLCLIWMPISGRHRRSGRYTHRLRPGGLRQRLRCALPDFHCLYEGRPQRRHHHHALAISSPVCRPVHDANDPDGNSGDHRDAGSVRLLSSHRFLHTAAPLLRPGKGLNARYSIPAIDNISPDKQQTPPPFKAGAFLSYVFYRGRVICRFSGSLAFRYRTKRRPMAWTYSARVAAATSLAASRASIMQLSCSFTFTSSRLSSRLSTSLITFSVISCLPINTRGSRS